MGWAVQALAKLTLLLRSVGPVCYDRLLHARASLYWKLEMPDEVLQFCMFTVCDEGQLCSGCKAEPLQCHTTGSAALSQTALLDIAVNLV